MKSLAEHLGQTPHRSPLLRRLRQKGLVAPDDLRRLAVARGCGHYRRSGDEVNAAPSQNGWVTVTNLELAMGMLSAAQDFDPTLIRCAAQLLSAPEIPVEGIAQLAKQERAVPVVRHIAQAGVELDPVGRDKWRWLLGMLPSGATVPAGRLPHRSRFISATGVVWRDGRLDRSGRIDWLRPSYPKVRA